MRVGQDFKKWIPPFAFLDILDHLEQNKSIEINIIIRYYN